jgi:hypothetical protein
MQIVTPLCWIALALIHAAPAAAAFSPELVRRLYGVDPSGDLGLLLAHRGALFLAVALTCLYAAISPTARRAATIVTAVSVVGFLILYARASFPTGPLRTIAIGDVVALLPLIYGGFKAWR